MPETRELARRAAVTALDRAEDWAALSDNERRLRAAAAIRDGDRDELHALLESYLLTFGKKGLRASLHTLRSYHRGLVTLLDFCDTHGLKVHHFTRQEALRYARALEAEGLAPASVNNRLSGARAFARALMWVRLLDGDPFSHVSVADPVPPSEKCRPYSREEVAELLRFADDRERVVVLLASDTGLRVSEAAALLWEDVDLRARRLVVQRGKGGRRRTVRLTVRAADALRWIRTRGARGAVLGVTGRRIQAIFAALCRRAGVERRGYHALRHSCGTRLYRATKDLKVTAKHLGHTTTRPTEIYTHIADSDYERAVDRLGRSDRQPLEAHEGDDRDAGP